MTDVTLAEHQEALKELQRNRKARKQREYYQRNIDRERAKGRERAERRASAEVSAEVADGRRERHREAQARYREKNANKLRLNRFAKTKTGSTFCLSLLQGYEAKGDPEH